ncbi:MAG: helix-turn-helix domain-containing protein [Candidatus Azobacteroides sp.]|nr:helix-turn-helix domain-containing protein [Candidatus Azobacteroides sp.]
MVRYKIKLTKEEVNELEAIINRGSHKSQTFRAAYILLNVDEGDYSKKITNERICEVLRIGMRTIDRVKKRFVEEGLETALMRRPSTRIYEGKINEDLEAKLVALSCSKAPEGFTRWSLRMLADKLVELKYIDSISHVTVGNVLKKANSGLEK